MPLLKKILVGSLILFFVIALSAAVKRVVFLKKERATPLESAPQPSPKEFVAFPETFPEASDEKEDFDEVDRVYQLFTTETEKLPIVETVVYTSRVPWLKGRPAWISDYASHYSTSRHFIARSLNKSTDYFTQTVSVGSKFNVFRKDKNFQFYLLVDLSRCKMGFYYIDLDTNERVLLKTYKVGVGKRSETISGTETPIGKYLLGDNIAVYKPGITALFQEKTTEMIQVFGTRWMPFEKEMGDCSAPSKGFGIHGVPWEFDKTLERWVERRDVIGQYMSEGCVRLVSEDIEELFSIVITKPTLVEIVPRFEEAKLPGVEAALPMR